VSELSKPGRWTECLRANQSMKTKVRHGGLGINASVHRVQYGPGPPPCVVCTRDHRLCSSDTRYHRSPIECPPGTQPGRELNSGRDFLKNSLAEKSRRAEMLEKTRLDPRQDAQQRSPDEGSSMP